MQENVQDKSSRSLNKNKYSDFSEAPFYFTSSLDKMLQVVPAEAACTTAHTRRENCGMNDSLVGSLKGRKLRPWTMFSEEKFYRLAHVRT